MKPKYAFALFAFITSVITGVLLLPVQASAASIYDNVINIAPDEFKFRSGYTNRFNFGEFIANRNWGICQPEADFALNLISSGGGQWAIYIVENDSYPNDQTFFIDYESEATDSTSSWSTSQLWLYPNYNSGNVNQLQIDVGTSYTNSYCRDNVNGINPTNDHVLSSQNRSVLETNIQVDYPPGYSGQILTPITNNNVYPNIGYAVDDNYLLRANYLRNLDISMDSSPGLYKLGYTVYESDSAFIQGDQLDYKSLSFQAPYEFQLPTNGYYLFTVSLQVVPPAAPRTDIKTVTFRINADGTFKIGSTTSLDCTNGICEDIATDCNYYTDVFQRMNCAMMSQINIGVINPSITSFKNLLTSFVVSSDPVCNVPISDIAIGNSSFPLSGYSAQACAKTAQFRDAFPIAAIVVNFVFALGLLTMIVALINRLTNKDKNNLIEGI